MPPGKYGNHGERADVCLLQLHRCDLLVEQSSDLLAVGARSAPPSEPATLMFLALVCCFAYLHGSFDNCKFRNTKLGLGLTF